MYGKSILRNLIGNSFILRIAFCVTALGTADRQIFTAVKRGAADPVHAVRKHGRFQASAIPKRKLSDTRHTLLHRHAPQPLAMAERPFANAHNTFRNQNITQAVALGKNRSPDLQNAVWKRYAP